jgi:hypothetical protein
MKSQILLLALIVAALSSCTTAYKTGQTPDDVYFSPTRTQDEYVQVEKKEDRRYEDRADYYDDRYLRMRVTDRARWSELDDWYYYGNRRDYSYYNSSNWNNPWTPCNYWNSHYNPYYSSYVIVKPTNSHFYNGPRTNNLNTYNNNMLTNSNYTNPKRPGTGGIRPFSNSGSTSSGSGSNSNSGGRSSNSGSILRNIFNNNSSSGNSNSNSSGGRSNSSSTTPASSSSSSSSSSGSSSGGSAPVRRF